MYATIEVSSSGHALIHKVIPIMDVLTKHLDSFKDDATLPPVVRDGAWRGLAIMNKYYSQTDESMIYRISMSKHSTNYIHMLGLTYVLLQF